MRVAWAIPVLRSHRLAFIDVPRDASRDARMGRFDKSLTGYLEGERFSETLVVRIADRRRPRQDRLSLLEDMARDRRVVHIGCVDHLEVLEEKMASGTWLHGRLLAASRKCVGIDIDAGAIDRLRELGIPDVVAADVTEALPREVADEGWDLVVLGEVLEHVDDPIGFLRSIRLGFASRATEIVVTVPNALSTVNAIWMIRGRESINSDHRFWFTPYTLAKVFTRAGIAPVSFAICPSYPTNIGPSRARRVVRDLLGRLIPGGQNDLVMTGRL
jgi:hypothetical protein